MCRNTLITWSWEQVCNHLYQNISPSISITYQRNSNKSESQGKGKNKEMQEIEGYPKLKIWDIQSGIVGGTDEK